MEEKYKIRIGESVIEYERRICGLHEEENITWDKIADIINSETERDYTESRYRKLYALYKRGDGISIENQINEEIQNKEFIDKNNVFDGIEISPESKIKEERIKLHDERVQLNSYIRRLARDETLKDIAIEAVNAIKSKELIHYEPKLTDKCVNSAIIQISDWHYGIVTDNYWNKYNPEIFKKRLKQLLDNVIEKCVANNVKDIYVANLSDLIAGRIHLAIRIESRYDVITQIINVSEYLSEFLTILSNNFNVHYYDCVDNHSRLEPDKKDSLEVESLVRITHWYLKERVGDYVEINENKYGDDIIDFTCLGHNIIGCHGHNDKPNDVVDNLTLMTHRNYDMILTAHLHHFSANEKNETLVVSNGTLMGTDTYAKTLRVSSKPSQNLIIVTEKNVCECLYRIVLD